ncbi:MAG TPA: DNA cytosine methyltransferase [Acidobacteriota bacterium]|nr:DNA cytosine methyltransferase [Acidobacteriota bacterium]
MDTNSEFACIDLFCGAGGLSEGFKQAGFRVLAANDADADCEATFRASHPETVFIPGPIEELQAETLLDATGREPGSLDCIAGGPPCQAFSVYNHKRGLHDERSGLFREYLRIVEIVQPVSVVMENVTGIFSVAGGRAVREIHDGLAELGYCVYQMVLKAEEFGVPQERRRVFFVGLKSDMLFKFPEPTHGNGTPFVKVADAIMDLPALEVNQGDEISSYESAPKSEYQELMRRGANCLYNHVAPNLGDINLRRFKHIPPGGSWRDIPFELLPAGMKRARRSDHTKRYGRLHPDGLASTILTKCDPHWGAFIHPFQERTLTVREAARFQSFPDRFRFHGSRGEQFRQVGNAVPPLLARVVASSVRNHLESHAKCLLTHAAS